MHRAPLETCGGVLARRAQTVFRSQRGLRSLIAEHCYLNTERCSLFTAQRRGEGGGARTAAGWSAGCDRAPRRPVLVAVPHPSRPSPCRRDPRRSRRKQMQAAVRIDQNSGACSVTSSCSGIHASQNVNGIVAWRLSPHWLAKSITRLGWGYRTLRIICENVILLGRLWAPRSK